MNKIAGAILLASVPVTAVCTMWAIQQKMYPGAWPCIIVGLISLVKGGLLLFVEEENE